MTLDRLAARTVAFSLPALTFGIAVGVARLVSNGEPVDALVVATIVRPERAEPAQDRNQNGEVEQRVHDREAPDDRLH